MENKQNLNCLYQKLRSANQALDELCEICSDGSLQKSRHDDALVSIYHTFLYLLNSIQGEIDALEGTDFLNKNKR